MLTLTVVAAVTFGAVVRSRDQNFTVGGGKDFDGRRARTPEQLSALNEYADQLLDYCHYGDNMCAVGSEPADAQNHLDYFIEHNEEAVKWVVQMAKADGKVSSGSDSPTKPSHNSTSSAIAKPAATASQSPSRIASATPTNDSEAGPAQTEKAASSDATGAASVVGVRSTGVYALLAGAVLAVLAVAV